MSVLLLMLPIMLIVLVGYCSARFDLLPEESNNTFTRFTFFIAMPCQLFLDFSRTPVSQAINLNYIAAFALSLLITGSLIYFYTRHILKSSLAESALSIMGSSQANTAYFAIPLFILVFNNPTPVIPILIFQVVILTTLVLLMIEHDLKKQTTQNKSYFFVNIFLIIIKNPIIVASILGVIFSYFHVSIFHVANKFFEILGNTAAPLALFALGQSLYSDLRKISKKDLVELAVLNVTKLILLPIIAFIIGKYIFRLDHFWLAALIIMAAMPAPKNMFIFAVKYGLDVKKAATVVASTTLLSFITLNILLMAFRSYL